MKKQKKLISIQKRLLALTLSITACVSFAFLTALLLWQGTYYRKDRLAQLTSISESAFNQVNNALENLSTLSLSIAYSTSVNDNYNDFFDAQDTPTNQYDSHVYYKKLTEILLSMMGPSLSIPQVYIYNMDHSCFGVGADLTYRPAFRDEDYDFLDFSSMTGTTTFTLPHADIRISEAAPYEKNGTYISALRSIKNNLNTTIGYVEVVQRYKTIFQSLDELKNSSIDAYVFSSDGSLIYPQESSSEDSEEIFQYITTDNTTTSVWNQFKNNQYLYHIASSPSGYIYTARIHSGILFSGFTSLLITMLGLSFPFLVLFFLICLQISHSFTKPIKALCNSINNIDLSSNQQLDFPILPTNILEVSQLNAMLHNMAININSYMDRLLLSQEQEIQAKILALQVQTNPHFIYNILFTISAMSASGMNTEIEQLCGKIGKLMHYCSSSKDSLVSLDEELYFTSMYVECMYIRFPTLKYDVTKDPQMSQIQIPKLILQLLVENSIKFCSSVTPPWEIQVTASMDHHFYYLSVSDNGSGFSPDKIELLEKQFQIIKASHILPKLELNGMGIINVYLRLLLIYGDHVEILLSDIHPHGAQVTLKIPIPDNISPYSPAVNKKEGTPHEQIEQI